MKKQKQRSIALAFLRYQIGLRTARNLPAIKKAAVEDHSRKTGIPYDELMSFFSHINERGNAKEKQRIAYAIVRNQVNPYTKNLYTDQFITTVSEKISITKETVAKFFSLLFTESLAPAA